jgi:DNA transposition AAA+ family ATPase
MPQNLQASTVKGTIAPTANIALVHQVMDSLTRRSAGVPGIGAFYGQSGLGKTFAAAYVCHPAGFNAVYVQCNVYDTMKSLTETIGRALGLKLKGRIAVMMGEVVAQLQGVNRPLVFDEADVLVDTNRLELVRNLHDASGVPVLILGEQDLPGKLRRHERFHNRVLVWQPAARCNLTDLEQLAKHYCPTITLAPELKRRLVVETEGVTRRVVTNLVAVKRWCDSRAIKHADAEIDIQFSGGSVASPVS